MHPEFPRDMVIRGPLVDGELGYNWMEVTLSTGVKRHVIVFDLKEIIPGDDNVKP